MREEVCRARSRSVAKDEKAAKGEKNEDAKEEGQEGQAEGEEGLNPPKKKMSPKLMAIIGAVVVLFAGRWWRGAVFFWHFGWRSR